MVLYSFQGQPGFYGEKVFVILKTQADLSTVKNIPDHVKRREAVYLHLVKNAEETQKDIRDWLNSQGIVYKSYYLVNAIELDADPILRAQIAARSDVDRILDSPILRPLQNEAPAAMGKSSSLKGEQWNIRLIGADKVQDELHVYGEGIIVGQSDSGAQGDHPEFASRYRGIWTERMTIIGLIPGMDQETGGYWRHGTHTLVPYLAWM